MTLQKKYLLIVNSFLVIVLAAFYLLDIRITERIMINQAIESLRELGDAIKASILSRKEFNPQQAQETIDFFGPFHKDIGILVLDKKSQVLASNAFHDRGRVWEEEEIWKILQGHIAFSHHVMSHNQTKVLDITIPLTREDQIIGALHISKSLESINVGLWEMKRGHMFNIISNLLLLSFLVNFITYRLIIKRVQSLGSRMEKVGEGEMQVPAPRDHSSDEMGRLERSFSAMVEKIANGTARLRETLAEKEKLLLQVRDFNLELEQKIQEVTLRLEVAHHELIRREKLATVGQLTAGIAHEIRNPLLIIKGSAEMLQKKVKGHSDLIRDIQEEADRVNRTVTELLEYARPLSPEMQSIPLRSLFEQAWNRVGRLTNGDGKGVWLRNEIPEILQVEADPALMEQALVNLLLNARQAIPKAGEIEVRATLTDDDSRLNIMIRDNGCGIAPEDLPKVFSPFFTKRKGGTGLGLSIAQKTIEAHRGEISIESLLGEGTTVVITFPCPRPDHSAPEERSK